MELEKLTKVFSGRGFRLSLALSVQFHLLPAEAALSQLRLDGEERLCDRIGGGELFIQIQGGQDGM